MTTFANVFLGNTANDHTGTPLRDSFQTINRNFANIANTSITAPVQSVAGRTGDIVLTINDVYGAASISYVNTFAAYTMGNASNWNTAPATIASALDELALRLRAAGH